MARKSKSSKPKASTESNELKGWQQIAAFLGEPISVVQRWASEGMPLKRQGRFVSTTAQELNEWMGRESGKPIHVATGDNDLTSELKRAVSLRDGRSERRKALEPLALFCQLGNLHVIGLQQLSSRVIDSGQRQLITDLRLQQALLGGCDFGLRFEHQKDCSRAQLVLALLGGHRLLRQVQRFFARDDAQFRLFELMHSVADIKRDLLLQSPLIIKIASA